jgi:hypothetical protein
MSRKKISIALSVVVVLVAGLALWRVQATKVKAAKREAEILRSLTDDDIALILKDRARTEPTNTGAIVKTPESRRAFLKGLKEYLSLAARARREGIGEDHDFDLSLRIKENGLLADLYLSKLRKDKSSFRISAGDIELFWNSPTNIGEFREELDALYSMQNSAAQLMESDLGIGPRPQGEGLEKARKDWARARILSSMARADTEFMQQRTTQLRLKILEAGVLSAAYLARYWKANIKATDQDIAAYLAAHPEWDLKKKREKAEVVLRRALAGEDFAVLANEFTEDRRTKGKGGLYESWEVGTGLWPEVENAALKLQPGQVADRLVETKDGFHIVELIDRTISKADNQTEIVYVSIRHILLQRRFEDPTVNRAFSTLPPPFKTPEEIAKTAVEKEKRQRFVDGIVQAENISLPDDFEF